jgi:3-hydroxyisobutyrate dehydrogenase
MFPAAEIGSAAGTVSIKRIIPMTITFLGQGAMGSRMADRLEAAGHAVTRWNRSGAAATPREAVAGAAFVIAMLRDDDASRTVWLDPENGALAGLTPGTLAIECSTLTVDFVRELDIAVRAAGGAFIDAPVLGSRPQAEAGQLIHLVGGDRADIDRAVPLLAATGARHLVAGPIGSGSALKLIANSLFGIQVAAVAELIGRMRSLGLDPADAIGHLAETPVLGLAARGAAALMLADRHDPMFPVHLVTKDFGYAIGDHAAAMPLTGTAKAVFDQASAAGGAGANLTVVARLYA